MANQPSHGNTPPHQPPAEIGQRLSAAHTALASGDPGKLEGALKACDEAIALLAKAPAGAPEVSVADWRADAHVLRGLVLLSRNGNGDLVKAEQSCAEAAAQLRTTPFETELPRRHRLGQALLHRANALLGLRTKEGRDAALPVFEEALEVLSPLPVDEPMFVHTLAATWINRGNAHRSLASDDGRREALRSYDQALPLLDRVPVELNPRARTDLAVAWMNRGHLLQEPGALQDTAESIRNHEHAIELLKGLPEGEHPVWKFRLAGAQLNHANALLQRGERTEAAASAETALAATLSAAEAEPMAAEIVLKCRQLLCQLRGQKLGEIQATPEVLGAITDNVEESLALIRFWDAKGLREFRPIAGWFFRVGVQIYAVHQPQFLAEFLLETLDPERTPGAWGDALELHQVARQGINHVRQKLMQPGFAVMGSDRGEELAAQMEELRNAETRLDVLAREAAARQPANNTTTTA